MVDRLNFTRKQRNAILERDGNDSQFRHYTEEKGFHTRGYCKTPKEPCDHLEVHHIKPRRVGGDADPRNLVTVSKCEHVGICPSGRLSVGKYTTYNGERRLRPGKYVNDRNFVIHPDMEESFKNYDGTRDPFQTVFDERAEEVRRGEIFWRDGHDIELKETAEEKTMTPGWKY